MPYFPVDDNFDHHQKAILAGNAAVGLWTRAGAYCMRNATDGVVRREELPSGSTVAQARKLVDVGLWHAPGHDCDRCPQPPERGWIFHDWTETGAKKTSTAIKADRVAARDRMRALRSGERPAESAGHVRANSGGVFAPGSVTPSPSPGPSGVQVVSQSQAETRATTDRLTVDDIDKIRQRLGATSASYASKVAHRILDRASVPVASPLRYVLASIDADPDEHRPTPGPLKAVDECRIHPGQPAGNCGGCVADERAADR